MGQIENLYANQLIVSLIMGARSHYEEALRSPEADLQASLVSALFAKTIDHGTLYAEKKGVIDPSIQNLALKLIALFGASWAVAYCKKISLKDVSLNLLPYTLFIGSSYFIQHHLFPLPPQADKETKNNIREKITIYMLIPHTIKGVGFSYLMFQRNPQIPFKSMMAFEVCSSFVDSLAPSNEDHKTPEIEVCSSCVDSLAPSNEDHKTPEIEFGAKCALNFIGQLFLDFVFQKTVGTPMIMSKQVSVLSSAGTYLTWLATHSTHSPFVMEQKNLDEL